MRSEEERRRSVEIMDQEARRLTHLVENLLHFSRSERRVTMSARDYIGHLSTISAYLELPASEQEQVYSRIMQVLPETIEIAADITVHLARRLSEQ